MTISASDAGDALSTVGNKLLAAQIVDQDGFSVLMRVAGEVRRRKADHTWSIEVDRGQPISFVKVKDRSGMVVTPQIVAKEIVVSQGERATPPFDSLDMALEINDERNQAVARWHLDLANKNKDATYQAGPLIHLQYGGHIHGDGGADVPLKAPRWCHPPMEIALLCEMVAANFYEGAWLDLRNDANWCKAIHLYQRLCYGTYVEKLMGSLSVSSSTALNVMWASSWGE